MWWLCSARPKVEEGGPDVLEEACNQDRSLFLCYPDDFEGGIDSLGLQCIQSFDGDVVRIAVESYRCFCMSGKFPPEFLPSQLLFDFHPRDRSCPVSTRRTACIIVLIPLMASLRHVRTCLGGGYSSASALSV